jgi:hypothetical protein
MYPDADGAIASALQALHETIFKKYAAARSCFLNPQERTWPSASFMQDDDGQAHRTPDEEEPNEATQSEYPHPTQVWRIQPQPVDEFIFVKG